MIVVYPMMVSNAISENTLPAISKMLEQYILIYMQDDYLSAINRGFKGPGPSLQYKYRGAKLIGESLADELKDRVITTGKGIKKAGEKEYEKYKKKKEEEEAFKRKVDPRSQDFDPDVAKSAGEKEKLAFQRAKNRREEEKHKNDMKAKAAKVKVNTSDRSITVEPTYMTVETDKYGTRVLGIKVVPYRVLSDAKLSALLMHDMQIKGISAATLPMGRKVLSYIWRVAKMKGHVTGDPKQDIIYRTTGHRGETFVALEKNHDIDEYFLTQTSKIKRLFKLGWGNFVICDDALQIAHFCLRATKGMCQALSYRMMYKTLGQTGVYEDLEDLRKQNSSIFKISGKSFSKLIGEAKADGKLYHYQER
jgi:hypothetical protein